MSNSKQNQTQTNDNLRLVAWEVTRNCNLSCIHCRASATMESYQNELDTKSSLNLLDQIAKVGKPIVILTGGEPLLRSDIFEIASYGTQKGLKMAMAVNATLLNEKNAQKINNAGIQRISISIDGATSKAHDKFRGVKGAFEKAINGIQIAKKAGIEFQINTTITKSNINQIKSIFKFVEQIGAVAHHIFLLVATGRGKYISDMEISADEYEQILHWFYEQKSKTSLQLKATCAPHYYRILRQQAKKEGKTVTFNTFGLDAVTRGCLGGTGFCFISHKGIVQPCGFLDIDCGDINKKPFGDIWKNSDVFLKLRDFSNLKGKCGRCEYVKVCGGCRARAYEATGDYLAQEPLCNYQPKLNKS